MCSRYMLVSPADLLAKATGMRIFPLVHPRYNAAPTQMLPVVRRTEQGDGREPAIMRWGLVPTWSGDDRMKSVIANARSETIAYKPAFRDAFHRRRCIVPADGFFEWKGTARGRMPWLFEPSDGIPFCFAGLWEYWSGPDAEPFESFTILTTTPNAVVGEFHDRMPVILRTEAQGVWMSGDSSESALTSLLVPSPEGAMRARPVNLRLNSVANDDPACIEAPHTRPAPGEQLALDF